MWFWSRYLKWVPANSWHETFWQQKNSKSWRLRACSSHFWFCFVVFSNVSLERVSPPRKLVDKSHGCLGLPILLLSWLIVMANQCSIGIFVRRMARRWTSSKPEKCFLIVSSSCNYQPFSHFSAVSAVFYVQALHDLVFNPIPTLYGSLQIITAPNTKLKGLMRSSEGHPPVQVWEKCIRFQLGIHLLLQFHCILQGEKKTGPKLYINLRWKRQHSGNQTWIDGKSSTNGVLIEISL